MISVWHTEKDKDMAQRKFLATYGGRDYNTLALDFLQILKVNGYDA